MSACSSSGVSIIMTSAHLAAAATSMPLAAIADDGDLLALDQVDVGVAIVINAHGYSPCSGQVLAAAVLLLGSMKRRDKPGDGITCPPGRDRWPRCRCARPRPSRAG